MTRKEEISSARNNYGLNVRKGYPRIMDETDKYISNAFEAGAKWADKSMIERARKWLEKELYLFYSGAEHWVASRRKVNVTEFLDDFEIAMQEE